MDRAAAMTRKPTARPSEYAVSDEAAAYIADALMELALQFEATHFAQIRRYYQSITPPGAGTRRRDPSGKQRNQNGRKRKTSDI
jgi:hypothetical protein